MARRDEVKEEPKEEQQQVGGATTTLSRCDQPTNQQPEKYVSLRVKLDHKYLNGLQQLFKDVQLLCIVEHGRGTSNEHFHVCLPGDSSKNACERYRKRVKDRFGIGGNGGLAAKGFSNGLRSFMFYCLHEGTKARYEDPFWERIEKDIGENGCYKKQRRIDVLLNSDGSYDKKDRSWLLTYSNIVVQAVKHRRLAKLDTDSLKVVVKDMIKTTKWRPSREMYKNGVCEAYELDFQFSIGARSEPDMAWWRPRS